MPSSSEAVNRLMPLPLLMCSTLRTKSVFKMAWMPGTSTTMPKKPYTTEGMPASSCTAGSSTRLVRGEANRLI